MPNFNDVKSKSQSISYIRFSFNKSFFRIAIMSATGNPRNKVALKPGHSLMDWIRLGNSGEDLAGTGGAILQVTKEQLAQHSTEKDAWLCIRGNVYNITRYMNFHPGGAEELMKGAGIDATNLFNKVHPWVNFESILKKCLVGRLTNTVDEDIFDIPSSSKKDKIIKENKVSNSLPVVPDGLKVDWYQQQNFITMVVYLKELPRKVIISNEDPTELWIWVNDRCVGFSLKQLIVWPPLLTVTDSKIEAKYTKEKADQWEDPSFIAGDSKEPLTTIPMAIDRIEHVNHNVFLIGLSNSKRITFHVPIGYHIPVKANINGSQLERNYTPVCGLDKKFSSDVNLLIKYYPDGIFSSWITSRKIGETVTIGHPVGNFSVSYLMKATHIILIAAGSGFTPMTRLVDWALARRNKVLEVKLIFFNKTVKDIIWKSELQTLVSNNQRFRVEHILSEPDSSWKKTSGWITPQLLHSYIPEFSNEDPLRSFFICVCGPISFTQLTERYLQDMGYPHEYYFCFRG